MNVTVRFYWQHDLDLTALCLHPDFDMGRHMKRAITAYVRGDWDFFIQLPRKVSSPMELHDCYCCFSLDFKEDKDVIDYLHSIRKGFRNSAMKIIFRRFLEIQNMDPFFYPGLYLSKTRSARGEQNVSVKKLHKEASRKEKNLEPIVRTESRKVENEVSNERLDDNKKVEITPSEPVKNPEEPKAEPMKTFVETKQEEPVGSMDIEDEFDFFGSIDGMY